MNTAQTVADNLRHYMFINDISITRLAELTNLSRNTVTNVRSGKSEMVKFETLEKVSNELGIEVQQLFTKRG